MRTKILVKNTPRPLYYITYVIKYNIHNKYTTRYRYKRIGITRTRVRDTPDKCRRCRPRVFFFLQYYIIMCLRAVNICFSR